MRPRFSLPKLRARLATASSLPAPKPWWAGGAVHLPMKFLYVKDRSEERACR